MNRGIVLRKGRRREKEEERGRKRGKAERGERKGDKEIRGRGCGSWQDFFPRFWAENWRVCRSMS